MGIAKRNGDFWESDLIGQCSTLRALNRASVRKLPDPVRIEGRSEGGKIHGRTVRREWPDFYGVIKGGMCVAFEAKSTEEENRFPLAKLRDTKSGDPSQFDLLLDVVKMGGVAFVALRHTPEHTFGADYILPVTIDGLLAGFTTDRPSLVIDDLGPFLMKPGQNWLDKIIQLQKDGYMRGGK